MADGQLEKKLINGKMRVLAIPTKFQLTIPETLQIKEFSILEVHPLICGSGPMSDDTDELTQQERFVMPTTHEQEHGYPSTPMPPSSAYSERSWTFLESNKRARAASSSSWEVL